MIQLIILLPIGLFVLFALTKFFWAEWRPQFWRTRQSSAANNWSNEGYMAQEDGKKLQDIDASISSDAPPYRGGSSLNGGIF